MLRFLVRRSLGALVILLVISMVTFELFFAIPQDPARLSCGKVCTPENLALIRHSMGLDESTIMQFWHWFSGIFTGRDYSVGHCDAPCFGYSFVKQEMITDVLLDRFPTTLSLTFGSVVVFLLFGVGTGMLAAHKQGKPADKIASSASLIASSMQIYVAGPLALYVFVYATDWLKQPAYIPITEDPIAWFSGLLVPWIVLSLIWTANYTRMTRSSMVEQLSEDYVRTARAKGMTGRSVFLRFAWRGAMGTIVTVFGIDLGTLLGGAIITETVFGLHGLGELAIRAYFDSDLSMLVGVTLVAATLIVVFNIIVDAAYALIDPRIRLA
ncbi:MULTISPECIES: ABC transporter permease [unclassified Kitasatospora]|uniref:ABC transporter permease n=1 Tax=unclassified Kitasatospora TaxID=2633591 RepID=UPI00070DC59B|nr:MULTISPECIES: ABC transporter permease [unclassified Kitasatospora]KQV23878.1 ABC transporter permease [Kitasatospora sp. Root107]KRB67409.1 ABC transporter permease [Kitasatospora sp. Root187]